MKNSIDIKIASEGLLMMSESDYPLEYFSTLETVLDEELILRLSGKPANTSIEIIELEYLFRNMIKVYPESNDIEKRSAERFKELISILRSELAQLKVYRIGYIQVDIFIAGITKEGVVAGLKTKLIET